MKYLNLVSSVWLFVYACLGALTLVLGCTPDKGSYWMDDPRKGSLEGLPLPSNTDWNYAREVLINYYEVRVRFQSDVQIDYFVSNGFWFAAVASRFEQDSALSRTIVGWLRGSQLSFARKAYDDSLHGESLRRYNELRNRDSLWTLFESGEFWLDTLSFEALYKASGITTFPNGDWFRGPVMIKVQALKREKESPRELPSHSGWMAYMAAITSHVYDSNMIHPTSGSPPTNSVDFVAHQEKWFFEFLSVTYDSKFAWSAIVGQHLGDSLVYRFVGKPMNYLEPEKVAEYKSAAKAGDIYALTGKHLIPLLIMSYQQLWDEAAATSETRVWRIGQDN